MSFTATALRIAAGVIVWALHFASVYGLTALACAREAAHAVPWAIGIPTVAALAVAAGIVAREWPRRAAFESWLAATLAALALVAIALETLPLFVVPPCV